MMTLESAELSVKMSPNRTSNTPKDMFIITDVLFKLF